jgi:hypothetical protein
VKCWGCNSTEHTRDDCPAVAKSLQSMVCLGYVTPPLGTPTCTSSSPSDPLHTLCISSLFTSYGAIALFRVPLRCRETGHLLNQCPKREGGAQNTRGVYCFNCGQDGHPSRKCGKSKIKSAPRAARLPSLFSRHSSLISRLAPRASRLAPRASRLAPRASRLAPRASHLAPRASHLAPRASRLAPRASRLAPRASRLSTTVSHL